MTDTIEFANGVSAENVCEYLRLHTDFLHFHPELIPLLEIPHQSGSAVSLVARQVKSLRDENRRLQGQLIDVLRTAQENESLYRRCNQLLNKWLLEPQPQSLLKKADEDLIKYFDIHAAKIIWNKQKEVEDICKEFAMAFPDNQPICGASDSKFMAKIFPHQHQIMSMAIVPIGPQARLGLLVLASNELEGFSATMGTIFLEQISAVLTALLAKP